MSFTTAGALLLALGTIFDSYRSSPPKRDLHDRLTLFVAAAALMLTVAVASIQALIARDTEVRQLRPYIGLVSIPTPEVRPGSIFVTVFPQENFGSTPAYGVKTTNDVAVLSKADARKFVSKELREPEAGDVTEIMPHASVLTKSPAVVKLHDKQLEAYLAGDAAIVSYGTIFYKDVFDHRFRTYYCERYFVDRSESCNALRFSS